MRSLGLLGALFLCSCLQIGLMDGADAGGGVADASADAKATRDQAETGPDSNCVVDPLSQVTLCTRSGICPGVAVDHDRHPNCGFRSGVGTIDIVCVCDDFLCSLGAALSCVQARDLLEWQSEIVACTQVNEGRCAPRNPSTGKKLRQEDSGPPF